MTTAPTTAPTNATPNAQRPTPFEVFCAGQIATRPKRVKSSAGPDYFVTILKVPARDAYSSPGSVNVRSSMPIGNPGEQWSGFGTVSGYQRTIPARTDPATGEIRPALVVADMYILAAE